MYNTGQDGAHLQQFERKVGQSGGARAVIRGCGSQQEVGVGARHQEGVVQVVPQPQAGCFPEELWWRGRRVCRFITSAGGCLLANTTIDGVSSDQTADLLEMAAGIVI